MKIIHLSLIANWWVNDGFKTVLVQWVQYELAEYSFSNNLSVFLSFATRLLLYLTNTHYYVSFPEKENLLKQNHGLLNELNF